MKKTLKFFAALLTTAALLFASCTGTGNTPVVPIKPEQPASLTDISSVNFAKSMIIGWNLGNAFDANGIGEWADKEGLKMEYNWLPHKQATSKKLIQTVAATGFNTIRIPVSWHNHMNKTTYQIDSAWMNRVKEVVDWALAEDMYVIINIHHDNLTEGEMANNPGFCVTETTSLQTKSKAYIQTVWEQIAETFKDYDNHLVFELLNEPRCVGTDWDFNETIGRRYNSIITEYEQVALNVIRTSGGNNATRFVMAPAYAAAPTTPTAYTFPTDTAKDKLLLSAHAYTPYDFALSGDKSDYDANKSYIESSITSVFNSLSTNYVKKGIGVVMGEASASDKNNTESRIKWANYYFAKAKAAGIPVVLWDNELSNKDIANERDPGENHGYFSRVTCAQYYPEIVNAMMKATYDEFEETTAPDEDPADEDDEPSSQIAFTINYTKKDGEAIYTVEDDWVSLEIEFEAVVNGMQFAVKSDALKEDHGTWKEYYTAYKSAAKTNTIVIADILEEIKSANQEPLNPITRIATIGIQNTVDTANTYKVVKSTVTKKDSTTVDIVPAGDTWNATVIE